MAPPSGALCAKHPEVAAVDVCQRCGLFVCGECVDIRAEDVFCADCARILDRPAPARPKWAFAFAAAPGPVAIALSYGAGVIGTLVGIGLAVPLSSCALALILQERSARRASKSPRGGAFYPLTWVMLALDLLAMLGFFALIQLRGKWPGTP